jgi:hypothetical protein
MSMLGLQAMLKKTMKRKKQLQPPRRRMPHLLSKMNF